MTELVAKITLGLNDKLSRGVQRTGRQIGQFSKRSRQQLKRLQSGFGTLGRGVDKLANRYSAIISTAALGVAVKKVGDLDARLERMGTQAGRSTQDMQQLKDEIFSIANQQEIRTDPTGMLDAIDSIVEKTGNLDFAKENLRNIGLVMQATGAQGKDVGEMLAEFEKLGIKGTDGVMQAIAILNEQGKMGAFTLQELAKLGPRVINAYAPMASSIGPQMLKEMGAVLQVIRMATGSSEQAATSFEAMMGSLSDVTKIKKLQKIGVQVFDPKLLEEGQKKLRPINELFTDIIKQSKGDITVLGSIFGIQDQRALNKLLEEYGRTKGFKSLEKFMDVQGNAAQVLKDSARNAKTFNAAMQSLTNTLNSLANETLSNPIQSLADAINDIDPERLKTIIERLGKIGLAIGGIIAARAVFRMGGGMFKGLGAGSAKLGGPSAMNALAAPGVSMARPMYVYVVNQSGDGFVGGGSGPGKGKPKIGGPKQSRWRQLGGKALKGTPLLGLGLAAMEGYNVITSNTPTQEKIHAGGELAGGGLGAWGGAVLGASIGSAVPVIGTAIGGALGGLLGYFGGSHLGGEAADWITAADKISDAADKMDKAADKEKTIKITDQKGRKLNTGSIQ